MLLELLLLGLAVLCWGLLLVGGGGDVDGGFLVTAAQLVGFPAAAAAVLTSGASPRAGNCSRE